METTGQRFNQWENNCTLIDAKSKMLLGWSHDQNLQRAANEAEQLIKEYRRDTLTFDELIDILEIRGKAHGIDGASDPYAFRASEFFYRVALHLKDELQES